MPQGRFRENTLHFIPDRSFYLGSNSVPQDSGARFVVGENYSERPAERLDLRTFERFKKSFLVSLPN